MASSDDDRDGRNAVARGYVLATRITAIGMQMAVPPLLGWWADDYFKTAPWCLIVGAILGFSVSMLELLSLAKSSEDSPD